MAGFTPEMNWPGAGVSEWPARTESTAARPGFETRAAEALHLNLLVRWAFYLSVFTIPFNHLYLPGTGGRIGVLRLTQLLLVCGVLSQPRVCLRFVPTALFWFLGYIVMRILWGLWLTPGMSFLWWPSSREFVEFLLWLWVLFNVLQFPDARRGGLWALGLGCSLCALFHVAGIGVTEVANGLDNRSSIFGQNANGLGETYAFAMIALLGLWMSRSRTWRQWLPPLPLISFIGIAMAKTGSRTAILVLAIGVLVLFFSGNSFGSLTKRVTGLLAIAAVLAVTLWQIPTVMERFQEINPQNIGQHNPRARMAPVLWKMFLRSPLDGLGPDSYEWKLTREAMPYLLNQHMQIVAHNLALLLLVETGIIGFLIFSAGLAKAIVAAWRARVKSCGLLPLALLLPLAVAGATVSDPSHQPVFWVAIAYSLAGAE